MLVRSRTYFVAPLLSHASLFRQRTWVRAPSKGATPKVRPFEGRGRDRVAKDAFANRFMGDGKSRYRSANDLASANPHMKHTHKAGNERERERKNDT